MTDAPILEVSGLSAGYKGATVLRDLDLQVGAGQVAVMLGANGAGKTTSLRALSGVVRPSQGEIAFAGRKLGRATPEGLARLGMAHVPEGRGVFSDLTVAEHFKIGPRRERLDAGYAYNYFPVLKDIRDRKAGLLSGGEQQMLSLGRALARHPQLLLVDELSLGLAPIIVGKLMPIVRSYAVESGAAVLLVEQHVQLALSIADHGYVLSHGRVTQHGSGDALRADRDLILTSYLGDSGEVVPRQPNTTELGDRRQGDPK